MTAFGFRSFLTLLNAFSVSPLVRLMRDWSTRELVFALEQLKPWGSISHR